MSSHKSRLNKFICESGLYSRRAADRLVMQGLVCINGRRAQVGDQVFPGDCVTVNDHAIKPLSAEEVIVIVLNKPVGVVSTAASERKGNIVDFVNHSSRIFPVGRLDKDSQGLILMTNKCELVNRLLGSGNSCEKEYQVTVNKPITDDFITGLAKGVPMLGVVTATCKVVKQSSFVFRITLTQGLNRQIRRMCKYFGYTVETLERVRIMHIKLEGLSVGEWRNLSDDEMAILLQAADQS